MKLKSGDVLTVNVENGAVTFWIIERDDVPRVEKEGRGWNDGTKAILSGADMAEFLDVISGSGGGGEIGSTGLSVEFEYDDITCLQCLILSVDGYSAELTWPERGLLLYAVRDLASKLFR